MGEVGGDTMSSERTMGLENLLTLLHRALTWGPSAGDSPGLSLLPGQTQGTSWGVGRGRCLSSSEILGTRLGQGTLEMALGCFFLAIIPLGDLVFCFFESLEQKWGP